MRPLAFGELFVLQMTDEFMKFYPKRKSIALLSIFLLLSCYAVLFLAFHSLGLMSAIFSFITFGIFIYFIFPVIKNQVVELKDNKVVVYSFGKGYELSIDDLLEIVQRAGGIVSYRFEKGTSRYQISPCAYYNGEMLENELNDIFHNNK